MKPLHDRKEAEVASVLQGELLVSSRTCLGKNTANNWIHQVGIRMGKEVGEDLHRGLTCQEACQRAPYLYPE